MKNKSKVVLALSSILTVSAGVAGVSTFAWFTATRSAAASISSIGVHSKTGNLSIAAGVALDSSMTVPVESQTFSTTTSLVGNGTMSDVSSGDGVTFYKPNWASSDTTGTTATSISAITANSTDIYFRQFNLLFKNNGTVDAGDKSLDVYINSGSAINAASTGEKDVNAAKAMRMAILDGSNNLLVYWQQGIEAGGYKYVAPATGETAYGVPDYAIKDATAAPAIAKATLGASFGNVEDSNSTTADAAKAKQKIGRVDPDATLTVLVKLWIEGTSEFCTTELADGGSANFALSFAGIVVA